MREEESRGQSISRVLSANAVATIHLGLQSPTGSSDLPAPDADHIIKGGLFDLALGGVYLAAHHCWRRGALLPHHFTLTEKISAVYFLLHWS